jgi:hypothetical protein
MTLAKTRQAQGSPFVFIAVILLVSTAPHPIASPADLVLIGEEISSCLLLGGGLIPLPIRAIIDRSVCICRFHSLLCRLPRASEPWSCLGCLFQVFPKGVAVYLEKRNKLFRPLLACVVL